MIHRADTRGQRRLRRPSIEALEERSLLATITVTGTGDTIAKDGVVTIREAITAANTNADPSGDTRPGDPGSDTIAFNIPGTGVHTIHLTSALPTITDPILIDGYSQPGSRANTLADGDDAVLLIELTRGDLPINGLTLAAGGSTVRGVVINGNITPGIHGIELRTNGGNRIEGNFIGPDATGTADVGTQGDGVFIHDVASNTIGGTTPAARNVISGNSSGSILILGGLASGNLVAGNFLGTNAAGTARLTPNEAGGVAIFSAPSTTIGGTTAGARNVITGSNSGIGIRDAGATGTLVQGNYIGIDVSGTTPLATSDSSGLGVAVGTSSTGTTIGGTTAGPAISSRGTRGAGSRSPASWRGTRWSRASPSGPTPAGSRRCPTGARASRSATAARPAPRSAAPHPRRGTSSRETTGMASSSRIPAGTWCKATSSASTSRATRWATRARGSSSIWPGRRSAGRRPPRGTSSPSTA
jgi:hypothetical protein